MKPWNPLPWLVAKIFVFLVLCMAAYLGLTIEHDRSGSDPPVWQVLVFTCMAWSFLLRAAENADKRRHRLGPPP